MQPVHFVAGPPIFGGSITRVVKLISLALPPIILSADLVGLKSGSGTLRTMVWELLFNALVVEAEAYCKRELVVFLAS